MRKLNNSDTPPEYRQWYENLKAAGIISTGAESPGDQFFVMKYKDVFTANGLRGYASAIRIKMRQLRAALEELAGKNDEVSQALKVRHESKVRHLAEYADQVEEEAMTASTVEHKIPD